MVRVIAAIAVGVGAAFFGLVLLLGNAASDGFVFAIGVTVALVPEALLPTVTLSLAWGAEQMAKRNVLVRGPRGGRDARFHDVHLHRQDGHAHRATRWPSSRRGPRPARRGSRAVGYDPDGSVTSSQPDVQRRSRRCSRLRRPLLGRVRLPRRGSMARPTATRWKPRSTCSPGGSESTSIAIDPSTRSRAGSRSTPGPRRMSVVVDGEVVVKGAHDSVLPLCDRGAAGEVLDAMTAKGLRVLAVAGRQVG